LEYDIAESRAANKASRAEHEKKKNEGNE